jgi:putative DNA methylase
VIAANVSGVPPTTPGSPRLIEAWFPYVEVSHLVAGDRRRKDPVYGVHKWFARRPPTLVRALLLASHLSLGEDAGANASMADFWRSHGSAGTWLIGATVYDPFMGGGTSLVESARMGAAVAGRDVDPIAVAVVGSELGGPARGLKEAADEMVAWLQARLGHYFESDDKEWTPLHWFWLMKPTCTSCGHSGLLYRDLIIATSSGRTGSVVRDDYMHVFCPDCYAVHPLERDRKEIRCCGHRHRITRGTFRSGKYHCASCNKASTYEDLGAATTPRVMIAVEETRTGHRRRIRAAHAGDRELATSAAQLADESTIFDVPLATERRDRRPVSAGYTTSRTLFTDRQWALFTTAFAKVRQGDYSAPLARELTLMLTGSLSANNVLCGYARDWGRLAPLFSVRGFSIPALSVELNPFHPTAGRGTLRSARARMVERSNPEVRRSRWTTPSGSRTEGDIESHTLTLPMAPASVSLLCRSADDTIGQNNCNATICVTDPPYFDYIAYSELSEFFRTWLPKPDLGGTPLLPDSNSAVESFARGLGGALKATLTRLAQGTPLVFTYHSASSQAWDAIGDAFDIADLAVVALWPVLADPHMGHHTSAGNCEWDVVVVARRRGEVSPTVEDDRDLPTNWMDTLTAAGFAIGPADRQNFQHAWRVGQRRFAYDLGHPTLQKQVLDPERKPTEHN